MESFTALYKASGIIFLVFCLIQTAFAEDTYVSIHNLTPFTLTRTGLSSIHVDQVRWATFPETIGPGTVAEAHISYTLSDSSDNKFHSTVDYSIGDAGGSVQIYLDGTSLYATFSGANLQVGGTAATTVSLGFQSGGGQRTPLFLGGGIDGTNIVTNFVVQNWMSANLAFIGCQPLRHLILPGSHDAGMSEYHNPTTFVGEYDVLTQTMSIYDQLLTGVRYFDMRPTISGGSYYTGHYGEIDVIGWQGANGQSMASVINDINKFTATSPEFIVLDFSNSLNTDSGYGHFNADEWAGLMSLTASINNRWAVNVPQDLTKLTLNDFIGGGQAAVIMVNNDGGHGAEQDLNGQNGWYDSQYFPTSGSYADTIDRNTMHDDQAAKLKANRQSPDDTMFKFSWTLTTGANPNGIISWAQGIYTDLFDAGWGLFGLTTANSYPNVVFIDAVPADGWYVNLIVSMNRYYAACRQATRRRATRSYGLLGKVEEAKGKRCSGHICE